MWHDNAERGLGSTGGPPAETNSRRCQHRTGRRVPAVALRADASGLSSSPYARLLHALGSRYGRLLPCQLLLALPHDAGLRSRTGLTAHHFVETCPTCSSCEYNIDGTNNKLKVTHAVRSVPMLFYASLHSPSEIIVALSTFSVFVTTVTFLRQCPRSTAQIPCLRLVEGLFRTQA